VNKIPSILAGLLAAGKNSTENQTPELEHKITPIHP
jgi:hypothetical protein